MHGFVVRVWEPFDRALAGLKGREKGEKGREKNGGGCLIGSECRPNPESTLQIWES